MGILVKDVFVAVNWSWICYGPVAPVVSGGALIKHISRSINSQCLFWVGVEAVLVGCGACGRVQYQSCPGIGYHIVFMHCGSGAVLDQYSTDSVTAYLIITIYGSVVGVYDAYSISGVAVDEIVTNIGAAGIVGHEHSLLVTAYIVTGPGYTGSRSMVQADSTPAIVLYVVTTDAVVVAVLDEYSHNPIIGYGTIL